MWRGSSVVYFGDHIYADLIEPVQSQGWRTGIVIKELEREVEIINSPKFQQLVIEQQQLTTHLNRAIHLTATERSALMERLLAISIDLKVSFNKNFGSSFKTFSGPTLFATSVARYADVYTSDIENLLSYPADHTFYPARVFLPHEVTISMPLAIAP